MTDTTQYPSIQLILGDAKTGTEIYKWSKGSVAALAAELHSLLTSNAVNAQLAAEWEAKHHALRTQIAKMGREMASVVDERDALKAQQPKVERKLREVKVVVCGIAHAVAFDGKEFVFNNANGLKRKYMTLSEMVTYHDAVNWTDNIIAQCLALKDDPYEPVETVDEVLKEFLVWGYKQGMTDANTRAPWCTRLRAACAYEVPRG